jgi:AcrR family transcriptional regulator
MSNTRQAIIAAAARLFAEKGYEGMTMKEIAREVGIKAPSLYAFFESKEDILLHIYRNVMTEHFQLTVLGLGERDKPIRAQLYDLLHAIMVFQLKEKLPIRIFMRLLLFPPEVFQIDLRGEFLKLEDREKELFSRMFRKGMESGEIRETDSDALAHYLLCVMDGLFWEMQRFDEETFWKRFHIVWEQFWDGIKAR